MKKAMLALATIAICVNIILSVAHKKLLLKNEEYEKKVNHDLTNIVTVKAEKRHKELDILKRELKKVKEISKKMNKDEIDIIKKICDYNFINNSINTDVIINDNIVNIKGKLNTNNSNSLYEFISYLVEDDRCEAAIKSLNSDGEFELNIKRKEKDEV